MGEGGLVVVLGRAGDGRRSVWCQASARGWVLWVGWVCCVVLVSGVGRLSRCGGVSEVCGGWVVVACSCEFGAGASGAGCGVFGFCWLRGTLCVEGRWGGV